VAWTKVIISFVICKFGLSSCLWKIFSQWGQSVILARGPTCQLGRHWVPLHLQSFLFYTKPEQFVWYVLFQFPFWWESRLMSMEQSDGWHCLIFNGSFQKNIHSYIHTFNGLFSGQSGYAGTRKVKHSGFYWSKRWWGGSGISWTICKSYAPRSRQITMPVSHHSIFYGPDALPDAQPTESKHWRQLYYKRNPTVFCRLNIFVILYLQGIYFINSKGSLESAQYYMYYVTMNTCLTSVQTWIPSVHWTSAVFDISGVWIIC